MPIAADIRATADGELRQVLARLGYAHDQLVAEYPVWEPAASRSARLDIVGFADPVRRDMSTAVIAGHIGGTAGLRRSFEPARALGTPALLSLDDDECTLWAIGEDVERVCTARLDRFIEELADIRGDLRPDQLLLAKQGRRQLRLFPIDVQVLSRSREAAIDGLSVRVRGVLHDIFGQPGSVAQSDIVSRNVVGALSALMIRDRFGRPNHDPVGFAANSYPKYFAWLHRADESIRVQLQSIVETLAEGVEYHSLSPEMLSETYEQTLVDEQGRRKFGVYYTPPDIARLVASFLPLEEIAPDARTIVDPTCGSGSMLLAAIDRLREAFPTRDVARLWVSPGTRQDVVGIDRDPMAVEIARLSLLLHTSFTDSDWDVRRGDALNDVQGRGSRPAAILSNPPWGSRWQQGRRLDMAGRFVLSLAKSLSAGGFLAVVLPSTFFEARGSREDVAKLRSLVAIEELWRLPEDIFEASSVGASVLVGRREDNPPQHYFMYRRILPRAGWRDEVRRDCLGDYRVLVASDTSSLGDIGLGRETRESLSGRARLSDIADVSTGPVPTPGYGTATRREGPFLWLSKASLVGHLRPVGIDATTPTTYPHGFNWRSDDGSRYGREKLLVSAVRSANNPWRLKTAIDRLGVIPRQSFHLVVPDEWPLESLATLFNSAVYAVIVDAASTSRSIRQEILRSLPVPPKRFVESLFDCGRALLHLAETDSLSASAMHEADDLVFDAFDIPQATRQRIRTYLGGFVAPERSVRYPESRCRPSLATSPAEARYAGTVTAVHEDGVSLHIPGVTNADAPGSASGRFFSLSSIDIPGTLCREGATFMAHAREVGGRLMVDDFRHQKYSYIDSVQELLDRLLRP